ncbi:MAG: PBECR4 domain-containing protein [Butyrivibrio sp.]|nr:PBECR4 domain-containing protein [Butyrivibrio sp.]
MIIYRNRETNVIDYIIVQFIGSNYYHLTGLVYKEDNGNLREQNFGSRFYDELVHKKLSIKDLKIKDNNTELKIRALPSIMTCYKYTNMIGDFNDSGLKLSLDKVMGNVNTYLGLKKISGKIYAPASCLYGDIRKSIKEVHQVIAIFIKETNEIYPFSDIKYAAKGHNLNNLDNKIKEIISLEKYKTTSRE